MIEAHNPPFCKTAVSRSTFYQGDCLEVLPLLASNSIDLIYCDLPFGTTQCSWDKVVPFDKMWEQVIRITKQNTPIVFHAQQPFTSALIMSNPKMLNILGCGKNQKQQDF